MFNKKAAIELSMNFFVILIISLVVFGSGLSLFWKIYRGGEEELGKVSKSVETNILKQLHGAYKVSVVPRSIDLERGGQYIVGIGIKNIETSVKIFKIYTQRGLFVRDDIICSFTPQGQDDCEADYNIPALKILGGDTEIRVEPNKQEIASLMIKSDKKAISGDYIVNLCICYDQDCLNYETCAAPAGLAYDKNYPVSKIRIKVI